MARLADGGEKGRLQVNRNRNEVVNEGFIKTPIEPGKPDTKFWEAEAKAEIGRENITKPKPKPKPLEAAFKEAEADANDF